mmetsp:Transcript_15025/g.28475  ORF Transcript_15025/g.28475 Transcript_15025/m.28475 type:complete len:535 (-) Transcript_15025:751-2355(-)
MVSCMPPRISVSSKRLIWLISNERQGFAVSTTRGAGRCAFGTSVPRAVADKGDDDERTPPIDSFKSKKEPIKLASILQHASQKSKALLNGINGSSSKNHPAHHFVAGGTPCDPAPPPFHLAEYGEDSLYTLVLLRHGESEWNALNQYTGWCDVNLTKKGQLEARTAGRLLYENGIELDQAFTSVLRRASFSCNMALNAAKQHWVPVTKTWRLNERHYGALQGFNKDTAWKELGLDQELVMQMRRSYDVRPPRMEDDHIHWHGNDRRYKKLTPDQLEASRGESLKDTADRIMPFFENVIKPAMQDGNKCIIVSHANTIRTLVKHIDNISDEDIKGMTIPTGIPLLYRLNKDMKPVDPQMDLEFRYLVQPKGYTWGTSRAHGFHGVYLGDVERLQDIQKKRDATNRSWQRIILRNIGKAVGWDMDSVVKGAFGGEAPPVVETRQLWWQIHSKMRAPEYSNMLLLQRMRDSLETLVYERKQRYVTKRQFERMIEQIHLDTEGHVVEPFVLLAEKESREERERLFYELTIELEEESIV